MPAPRVRFFVSRVCVFFAGQKAEVAELIEVRMQWAQEGGQARGLTWWASRAQGHPRDWKEKRVATE